MIIFDFLSFLVVDKMFVRGFVFSNYYNNKKLLEKIKKFHDLQKVLPDSGHLNFSGNFEL